MRDVPVNHRYEKAYFLGDAYNLNLEKTSGVYYVTSPTNGPVASRDYYLEVIATATYVYQRAIDKVTGAEYKRVYDGSSWGSWAAAGFEASVAAVTSGAAPVELTAGIFRHNITTGGTQGAEEVTLPDGQYVGQRIYVHVATLTDPGDSVDITLTNLAAQSVIGDGAEDTSIAAMSLDAADDYLLAEWTGVAWNLLYSNGTVTLT